MNVFFDDRQDIFVISDALKKKIIKCIETALKVENKRMSNVEVSVSFVTNEEIKNINSRFRNIDKETDVLSFPMDFEASPTRSCRRSSTWGAPCPSSSSWSRSFR